MNINPNEIVKKPIDSGDKPKWLIFLICVLLAFVFWILQSLENNYKITTEIYFNYINFPENLILSKPLPEKAYLLLKAKGWDIIRLKKWTKTHKLTINLKSYHKNIILSDYNIRNFLPDGFEKISIISVNPPIIKPEFDRLYLREVPVIPNIKIEYRKHFFPLDSFNITPAKVKISGPEKQIKEIKFVRTKFMHYKDVHKNLFDSVLLVKPENKQIHISNDKVLLRQIVEQLTEGNFTINIKMPEEAQKKYLIIPDKVHITFQSTLSQFSSISPSDFQAFTNPESSKFAQGTLCRLEIKYDKTKIHHVRYSPEYVNFILKK